jgi:hypothetical protein
MNTQTICPSYAVTDQSSKVLASEWNPVCHITYTRDTWVKLLEIQSEYAFDEAKLLCQESPDTWVVWIPDHGQAILNKSDFYC